MRSLLAALLLLAPMTPALAQSRDACAMLQTTDVEAVLGTTAEVVEENGAGTGMSLCNWRNEEGQGVRLHSITAASQGIVGGTPLDYFRQTADARKQELGDMVQNLDGPWQAGMMFNSIENNPDMVFSVSFINKDDTVTLETYGLDIDDTTGLAAKVAQGM